MFMETKDIKGNGEGQREGGGGEMDRACLGQWTSSHDGAALTGLVFWPVSSLSPVGHAVLGLRGGFGGG